MMHVRVTYLEAFRRIVQTDFGSEADLIASLRGDPPAPSWQMECGTAMHRILENPAGTFDPEAGVHRANGYAFSAADVSRVVEHIGPGLREVTARRVFDTPAGRVEVQGTCDHIQGMFIRDQKCKFAGVDAREYEMSLQWKMYLLLHGGECFRYDCLALGDPAVHDPVPLKDITSFSFWRYPDLEKECRSWVHRFAEWAAGRGLAPYLARPPRQDAAA